VSGIAVTFQNNSLGWVTADGWSLRANTECCFLLRPLGTKPLGPEPHWTPHYRDERDQSREVRLSPANWSVTAGAFIRWDEFWM